MALFGSPPSVTGCVSCEAGGVMPLAHNICTLVVFSMPVCGLAYSFFIMDMVFVITYATIKLSYDLPYSIVAYAVTLDDEIAVI